jgi:alpha-glucosidase
MIRPSILLLAVTAGSPCAIADPPARDFHNIDVVSPDGNIRLTLKVDHGAVRYEIARAGKSVIEPSSIDVRLKNIGSVAAKASIQAVTEKQIDESSDLPWGKVNRLRNHCRETTVQLKNDGGVEWELQLRAYDNGIAFRYGFPEQPKVRDFVIEDEATQFRLLNNPTVMLGAYDNFTTSHEPLYTRKSLSDVPTKKLIEMPLLAVWPGGSAATITEARLRGFAGMYLERSGAQENTLRSRLAPLPSKPKEIVASPLPRWSPWRVVLLADRAGQLLENNVLLCLNDPAQGDFSWAKPGKMTWHWWNGTVEHGAPSTPDTNFAIHKKYIDFCAAHHVAYHSVISVAEGRPWYVQGGGPGYDPRPDTDVLTPRPDLGLPRILAYAKEKGIGIRLWVYWKPLSEKLEEAFATYERWGIKGLMVDFMDRDDQQMVEWQENVLQSAARHKLHIQFHGSYKFSGEQRTYPNLFNREGVLNLEYLKWTKDCTPQHDVDVAYTRALAGPVDYHLGGFRAAARDKFEPRDEKPEVLGTRCHQLAMYVVFENPMPMVCDYPEAYEGQRGFDFLEQVPTTWDETRFVVGEPGEFVVVARRSWKTWYLGGMTNWTSRKLKLPLDFLGGGAFTAFLRTDDRPDGSNPNDIREEQILVDRSRSLDVKLASGGGVVADIRPVNSP